MFILRQTKIPLLLFRANLVERFGAESLTLAVSSSFNYVGKNQETRVPKLSFIPSIQFSSINILSFLKIRSLS